MSTSSYFQKVYDLVRQVPLGRVTTYGDLFENLGEGSARAVGWAMNNSQGCVGVPAHRVVNRVGFLSGKRYFSDLSEMQKKLESEGVIIINDYVQNFESLRFTFD